VNTPTTPTAQQVAEALALIPDCDGVTDCYFCAAADLARAVAAGQS
jgi:hypothetical protein